MDIDWSPKFSKIAKLVNSHDDIHYQSAASYMTFHRSGNWTSLNGYIWLWSLFSATWTSNFQGKKCISNHFVDIFSWDNFGRVSPLTSQLLDLVTQGEPHVRRPGDSPHLLGDDGDDEFGGGEANRTKFKSKFHFLLMHMQRRHSSLRL